jgi:hypothetical protein
MNYDSQFAYDNANPYDKYDNELEPDYKDGSENEDFNNNNDEK